MKRVRAIFFAVLLIACSCLSFISCSKYSSSELFDYVKDSVAEIITYDKKGNAYGLGSGFVYSEDGKIITNYHVIKNGYSAKVALNGVEYPVKSVLAYDEKIDVAVLKIEANNLHVVPICSDEIKTGDIVYAMGSSNGFSATISNGIVSHADREMDGVTYVQHNAAISPGNSGGPLINEYGEIIGINTFSIVDSQNLNFAISVTELYNLVYATELTMYEFFMKECDPLSKLKNYMQSSGRYYEEDDYYKIRISSSSSKDIRQEVFIYYYTEKDYITLDHVVNRGEVLTCIKLDELDGKYEWIIFYENYCMSGDIYAKTFKPDSILQYNNDNIFDGYLRNTIQILASETIHIICTLLKSGEYSFGVTISDLGFVNY